MLLQRKKNVTCLLIALCWAVVNCEENNMQRHEGKLTRDIPIQRWDYWSEWSACTVDCGTGVTTRDRHCRSMLDGQIVTGCAGRGKEIRICEITGCIREAHEITACRKLERKWYSGKRYRWSPYTHPVNPCELACRPEGGSFYMGLGKNVSDGTPCTEDKSKVCVYGQCQTVGCDDIVGSNTKMDRCGVCGGTGSTCRHVSKTFKGSVMSGYHKIATIPVGSTNIRITEKTASRNYLAARSVDGSFRINTLFRLSRYGDHPGVGTLFTYASQTGPDCPGECISADGPIDTAVEVMMLSYVHNDGITYSYNVPSDGKDTYTNGEDYSPSMVFIDGGVIPNLDTRDEDKDNKRHIFSYDFKFKKKNRKTHRRGRYNTKPPDGPIDSETDTVEIEPDGNRIYGETETAKGSDNKDNDNMINKIDDQTDRNNHETDSVRNTEHLDFSNSSNVKTESNNFSKDKTSKQIPSDSQDNEINLTNNNNDIIDHKSDIVSEGDNQLNESTSDVLDDKEVVAVATTSAFEHTVQTTPFIVENSVTTATTITESNITDEETEEDESDESIVEEEEVEEEEQDDLYDSTDENGNSTETDILGELVQRNTSTNTDAETDATDGDDVDDVDDESDEYEDEKEDEDISENVASDMYNNDNHIPSLYSWRLTGYSQCSQTCGEGKQSPVFECIVTDKDARVDSTYCSELETPRLPVRPCNNGPCPSSWKPRSWSKCSVTCDVGTQTRDYVCTRPDGAQVGDNECSSVRPRHEEQTCDMGSCTQGWYFTDWPEECPAQCGYGKITRRVHCASETGNVMTSCPQRDKPDVTKRCRNNDCTAFWLTGPWSKCNATCGEAYQTRSVACAQKQRHRITVVTDAACQDEEKPATFMSCDLEPCIPDWFMNEWGECSVSCGEGYKSRDVRCLDHRLRPSRGCNERLKPDARESCSMRGCPAADQSRWNRPQTAEPQAQAPPRPRPRPTARTQPLPLTEAPPTNCQDSFSQCSMVIRARLCRYSYYAKICCLSCSRSRQGR